MLVSYYFPISYNLPGIRKSPEFLIAWCTRLLDCSAFHVPIISHLFSKYSMDTLQPTSWLLAPSQQPTFSWPLVCCCCHFAIREASFQIFCPFSTMLCLELMLQQHCCWKEFPVPFGFLALPTMEHGKYLVLCSTGCGGIKGRNQSLLVRREHLICQKQPAQLGFPFQIRCDDSENREDNELFMNRSCLFTSPQSCEWPVQEKHPGFWPHRGWDELTWGHGLQREMNCLLKSKATWELTVPWDCTGDTQCKTLNEYMSLLGLYSRRTLQGTLPAPTLTLMKGSVPTGVKEKEHNFPFIHCPGIWSDSSQRKLKAMMQFSEMGILSYVRCWKNVCPNMASRSHLYLTPVWNT